MRTITLTRGYVTVVDDDDYERFDLGANSWTAHRNQDRGGLVYAYRSTSQFEREAGWPKAIRLHRLLCGVVMDRSARVDHRNHDALDNRRENLRICTITQNNANQRKTRGSSRYKGVTWNRHKGKWQAGIGADGKLWHIGYYDDEAAAAVAYDWFALTKWGEFALLNFPVET